MDKIKFPQQRIDKNTRQEEIPTVREIVEKINEIINWINK